MKSKCNCCGECCRVINLQYTKKRLMKIKNPSVKFILEHWYRISREEAHKRQPSKGYLNGWSGSYFYVCDAWDEETRLCKIHESRPEICSGFPFYGKDDPGNGDLAWLTVIGCGYVEPLLAKAIAQSSEVDN